MHCITRWIFSWSAVNPFWVKHFLSGLFPPRLAPLYDRLPLRWNGRRYLLELRFFALFFFLNAPPALQRDLRLPPYNSSHVCPSARITKQSGTPQPEFWWKDMLTWNRSRRTLRSRVSRLHRAANLLRSE